MSRKNIFSILVCILIATSCHKPTEVALSTDVVSLPIDVVDNPTTPLWQFSSINGNQVFSYFDPYDFSIIIRDFKKWELTHIVPLEQEGRNSVQCASYYLEKDSIVIVGSRSIYISDYNGKVNAKINLTGKLDEIVNSDLLDIDGNTPFKLVDNINFWVQDNHYDSKKRVLYFPLALEGYFFDELPLLGSISLNERTITLHNIMVPNQIKLLRKFRDSPVFSAFYYPYISVNPNGLIYNFSTYENSVFQCDENLKPEQKYLESEFRLSELIYKDIGNKTSDELRKVGEHNPHFGHVQYDKFRNFYYRTVYQGVNYDTQKMIASLQIFDDNFNSMKVFPIEKEVVTRSFSVTEQGIIFKTFSEEEEVLRFSIFQPKKIVN